MPRRRNPSTAPLLLAFLLLGGCAHTRPGAETATNTATDSGGSSDAPATAEWVPLPCDWPAGATFTYEYTRRRTDTRNPLLEGVSSVTPLTVEVVRGGDPAAMVWRLGQTRMEGPEAIVNLAGAMLDDLTQVPLELELTDGSVTDLTNHTQVIEAMGPMLQGMYVEDEPEVFESPMALFRNPAVGIPLLTKEPARFFAMHCVQMSEGEVLEGEIESPNPFGGAPIASTSRVELTKYDRDAGTVTFETIDATDPEAVRALLPALLEQFAPDADLADMELDEILAAMPPIESTIVGTLTYSVADGFPVELYIQQDVGARGHPLHRSDTWIWVRVEDE